MAKTRRQPYTYSLAAGQEMLIPFVGNFFRLISWSGDTGKLEVALGDGEALNQMDVGDDWEGSDYNAIRIHNNGSSTGTIKFVAGNGSSRNWSFQTSQTLVVNPAASSIVSGGIAPTTTKGAVTIAANANRREIELYNSGATIVWVGASTVDGGASPAVGTPVDVGERLVLSTSAKLYFHSIGSTGAISYNEHVGA